MSEQRVATKETLIANQTQLVLQRAQAKDQIEQIERTLQIIDGMLKVYTSVEAAAQAASKPELVKN